MRLVQMLLLLLLLLLVLGGLTRLQWRLLLLGLMLQVMKGARRLLLLLLLLWMLRKLQWRLLLQMLVQKRVEAMHWTERTHHHHSQVH